MTARRGVRRAVEAVPASVPPPVRAAPAIDGAPPVSPTDAPGEKHVGRNTIETLLFRGLSTPVALLLVVIQSRFLAPEGRGTFVLVVLSVTIASRLLGQLGLAVTARTREGRPRAAAPDRARLRPRGGLGVAGGVAVSALSAATEVPTDVALIAAAALVPNVIWQTITGVLLGVARVRVWNLIQALSPLATLLGMLILVVWLDTGVPGAVVAWTMPHVCTAAFAQAASRDLWLPLARPVLLDEHGRTLLRLALAMGAVQVVTLIGYRAELAVLEVADGVAAIGV